MKGPTPRRLKRFVWRRLHLAAYLERPGDGSQRPQISAGQLLWAQLVGQALRAWHAIEALVRSAARRALGVTRRFGDDALAYFTERLDPAPTRQALVQVVRRAKRNKAFEDSRFIGLARGGASRPTARCAIRSATPRTASSATAITCRSSVSSAPGLRISTITARTACWLAGCCSRLR